MWKEKEHANLFNMVNMSRNYFLLDKVRKKELFIFNVQMTYQQSDKGFTRANMKNVNKHNDKSSQYSTSLFIFRCKANIVTRDHSTSLNNKSKRNVFFLY